MHPIIQSKFFLLRCFFFFSLRWVSQCVSYSFLFHHHLWFFVFVFFMYAILCNLLFRVLTIQRPHLQCNATQHTHSMFQLINYWLSLDVLGIFFEWSKWCVWVCESVVLLIKPFSYFLCINDKIIAQRKKEKNNWKFLWIESIKRLKNWIEENTHRKNTHKWTMKKKEEEEEIRIEIEIKHFVCISHFLHSKFTQSAKRVKRKKTAKKRVNNLHWNFMFYNRHTSTGAISFSIFKCEIFHWFLPSVFNDLLLNCNIEMEMEMSITHTEDGQG